MVGFIMRVTERGGITLGSMLSNKNLWTGTECGRPECRPCRQTGEKREDCIRRNILYESQCEKCVSDEQRGNHGLGRREGNSTLYLGESAISLFERGCEHWQATSQMKEESNMHQHMQS